MRRIYPFARITTFDMVAAALAPTALSLAEVTSCTFPGRPEPRTARWETDELRTVLAYEYLPDIELRFLHVLSPDFRLIADVEGTGFEQLMTAQLGAAWCDSWSTLRAELLAGEHAPSNRAAAAFAVAIRGSCESVDGQEELLIAIETAALRGPIAAAHQLSNVAGASAKARLGAALETADDVELRLHLRRAYEKSDSLNW